MSSKPVVVRYDNNITSRVYLRVLSKRNIITEFSKMGKLFREQNLAVSTWHSVQLSETAPERVHILYSLIYSRVRAVLHIHAFLRAKRLSRCLRMQIPVCISVSSAGYVRRSGSGARIYAFTDGIPGYGKS